MILRCLREELYLYLYINMKLPKNFIKMLENKYVLYFVLFLAVTNVLGYIVLGNINAAVFFILVGFLVFNFSKNMIIVLSIPLILTSILMIGKGVKEGLENKDTTPDDSNSSTTTKKDNKKARVGDSLPATGTDVEQQPQVESTETETETGTEENGTETGVKEAEPFKAGFQSDGTNKRRNRIDYAATVEDAYGDLNKVLGGDGVKRLTEDTQKLMSQQMQLADAMKNMGPLLEQAKGMLKGFDFKELGGIANLAKNFGGLGAAMPKPALANTTA
jgi:hypothetical protein